MNKKSIICDYDCSRLNYTSKYIMKIKFYSVNEYFYATISLIVYKMVSNLI